MANPTVVVTRIGTRFHIRLWYKNKVYDEMACKLRLDIGWCCRSMLRFFDKCGGSSKFANAARHRQTEQQPVGKVWYANQLNKIRRATAECSTLHT